MLNHLEEGSFGKKERGRIIIWSINKHTTLDSFHVLTLLPSVCLLSKTTACQFMHGSVARGKIGARGCQTHQNGERKSTQGYTYMYYI